MNFNQFIKIFKNYTYNYNKYLIRNYRIKRNV